MGYLHIDNLYKNTDILLFRECYALEKIHGTSAKVIWKEGKVIFFSGGAKYEDFARLFSQGSLEIDFRALGHDSVVLYGEAYGGEMQGMRDAYGETLSFVVFDVKIDGIWLTVPNAEDVSHKVGLPFVHYERIATEIPAINEQRDTDSVQAVRNGCGVGQMREGVVLRPLVEVTKSNGNRVISKHKRDEFKETRTPREIDPEKLKIREDADDIALEWVTDERLRHVLDKLPQNLEIEDIGKVIKAMVEDVLREAESEIVDSKEARKAVGRRAALLFKRTFQARSGLI